jgi:hypothetical protein
MSDVSRPAGFGAVAIYIFTIGMNLLTAVGYSRANMRFKATARSAQMRKNELICC